MCDGEDESDDDKCERRDEEERPLGPHDAVVGLFVVWCLLLVVQGQIEKLDSLLPCPVNTRPFRFHLSCS